MTQPKANSTNQNSIIMSAKPKIEKNENPTFYLVHTPRNTHHTVVVAHNTKKTSILN